MPEPSPIHERHLRRLADMDARADVIARGIEDRIATAETAAEVRDLALAYQRVTRGIRQIIALEAKLDHEQRQAARQVHADAERAAQARTQHRKAHVQAAVERLIWTEAEPGDAERLSDELDDLLDLEAFTPDFTDTAIDGMITRLAHTLGLTSSAQRGEERVVEGASLIPVGHDP